MTFHIFNPEHEMALAGNQYSFTPPHVVRAMRVNLGYLPALWAKPGDVVIVDDVKYALKAARKMGKLDEKVLFLTCRDAAKMLPQNNLQQVDIQPWGWDKAVNFELWKNGFPDSLMPDIFQLKDIRTWSNRATAARMLRKVRRIIKQTVGESTVCHSFAEMNEQCFRHQYKAVVKAPWSCSGRGIRYIDGHMDEHTKNWVDNIIKRQGSVTVEPLYNKVIDLGMEFTVLPHCVVRYDGLSVFHTGKGAYMGNVIATEEQKMERLSKYVSVEMLEKVKVTLQKLLNALFAGKYVGPLGIDMMVVAHEGQFLLHPLVEMNLRRTMGHVALAFDNSPLLPERFMRVRDNANFELHVKPIENAFVKVL